ncbi:hypothetical protein ACWCYY_12400 [Kitasatospora sp. NPDC001664]
MSGDWWVVFLLPAAFWVPLGPFVMAALGVSCARNPGRRARFASVLLPLLPVTVVGVVAVFPTDTWDEETWLADFLGGYVGFYIGLVTVLPWLLGYLAVRVSRAVRARRGPAAGSVAAGQEDISPPR